MIRVHLPSKCYSSRVMSSVDGAVIHFISAKNIDPSDPFNRQVIMDILKRYGFSYHYLIERDGTVVELVPDNHRAYHAGKSIMNGRENCNNFTRGIVLAGGSEWDYINEQIIELGKVLIKDMTEHSYNSDWVQGHDDVRANWNAKYPNKKEVVKVDPGSHFSWEILRDMIASVSMQIKYEQSLKG